MACVPHSSDAAAVEIPIDRQGRVVIPRHLRSTLGPVPGTVHARRVDGGLLLEHHSEGEVVEADDGLPVLVLGTRVTNAEVLEAIDAERSAR